MAGDVADHEGLMPLLNHEVPNPTVGKHQVMLGWKVQLAYVLFQQFDVFEWAQAILGNGQHLWGEVDASDAGLRVSLGQLFNDEPCSAAQFENVFDGVAVD